MLYRDTENGTIYTLAQLQKEYTENAQEIYIDSGADTFADWLNNCLDNGFLEVVKMDINKENLKNKLSQFADAYIELCAAMDAIDLETDVNNYIGAEYPFSASFDELNILSWVDQSVKSLND